MNNIINRIVAGLCGLLLITGITLFFIPDVDAQSFANRRPTPVEFDQLVGVTNPIQDQINGILAGTNQASITATTVTATTIAATTATATTLTSATSTNTGTLTIPAAGALRVIQGSNGTAGKTNLVAGAAFISTTNLVAGDIVMVTLTPSVVVGVVPYVSNIVAGTGFYIVSTNTANATNTAYWWIIRNL